MLKKIKRFLLVTVVLTIFVSCQSTIRFSTEAVPDFKSSAETGEIIEGKASYYAEDFHGRKTSNGEIYDMYKMTAAHKKLPFNTLVRVTNLKNHRSVVVRINDRGPFKPGRILDLSKGAAQKLEMINDGVIPVKLEVLGTNIANN
jgi:rare lipoprotein A